MQRRETELYNIEAEKSIISAILVDNKTLDKVTEIVSPDDFYLLLHNKILAAMVSLHNKKEPIDYITLKEILRGSDITFLSDLFASPALAVHHAQIVRNYSLLRHLGTILSDSLEKVYGTRQLDEDLLNEIQQSVLSVSVRRETMEAFSLKAILDNGIAKIESRGYDSGIPTCFNDVDSIISGLQKSDLLILAARPSMGKTAFALAIAKNISSNGKRVLFFSLEMSKEQLGLRMLCGEAQVLSQRVKKNTLTLQEHQRLLKAAIVLSKCDIIIIDRTALTAKDLITKSRKLNAEQKIDLVIVDYMQLMKSEKAKENREQEISEVSRGLKALAKEIDVPVIALSQLNRKAEDRDNKRPRLGDLRESGAIEQDADIIMFIYRDDAYHPNSPEAGIAELSISKHRNGPTGVVKLRFKKEYAQFLNN